MVRFFFCRVYFYNLHEIVNYYPTTLKFEMFFQLRGAGNRICRKCVNVDGSSSDLVCVRYIDIIQIGYLLRN